MTEKNALYIHAFNLLPEFGPSRLLKIFKGFKEPKSAFFSDYEGLIKAGIEEKVAESFLNFRDKINLQNEADKLNQAGIQLLSFEDENYPKLLLEIPRFPPLLYFRGKMDANEELCIAVVGSRKITAYGLTIIPDLIGPLVEAGVTIVSGLAFGADSEAHKQATKKNKRTVAVLGGGIDDPSIYPKHHQLLAQEILAAGGALLSEYPMGTPNFKQNFVARNRIISGLSLGTVVTECNLSSGSLITAKYALEQNRQVYAVPGPIYAEMSKGPNNLIKMGAKLITETNDILEDLNLTKLPKQQEIQNSFSDTPTETAILKLLTKEPMNANIIIKSLSLDAGEISSALTFLEMKGKVRNLGGQQYILSR